ncbi:hypothetical protein ACIPLC_36070 [Kitasatospora sp. NPDC086801]|uniref:hypothetical protein n=1 Tax=Kitasatospora sp. NPDC086801 TaxID=3364066 RepID=UPI00380F3CF0
MARPDPKTREAGRSRIEELKKARDEAHAAADLAKAQADEEMWQAIDALITDGQILQSDAAAATGYTRDHVAKQTARHRATS